MRMEIFGKDAKLFRTVNSDLVYNIQYRENCKRLVHVYTLYFKSSFK